MKDNTIFSLRFGSNVKLEPSADDLRQFLESKKPGSKDLQGNDLVPYWELLSAVANYKTSGTETFQAKLLFTVLSHSHFAKPALRSVVELYKYHLHSLSLLDFKKPAAFIKSAEEEIARLTPPKKREETARVERLRAMIDERKQIIDREKGRWLDLAGEMSYIMSYISENLGKIEKLCEQSIGVLVNEQLDRKKEGLLIEDIKYHFKERLRESLHKGTIRKEDLETAKEAVAELSKRTADLVRSDIYALTQLYETVHTHAKNIMRELAAAADQIAKARHAGYEGDLELYIRTGKILVALVSDCRFNIQAEEISVTTEQDALLVEKRKEMFDHLVDLLQKT